ncbi:MAG: dihydroorotate dehydrogenase electron transfer subunit [Bacteroidales bacterium]|nr:dihydroorotate dehydrogenase electron transfer subunit [Bacteroidales bacterium]
MKKFILDFTVVENVRLNYQYVLLKLTHNKKLPPILPGQFAQVRVDGSPETFLRRPISINFVDSERNELWLLIQVVGAGTRWMSELKPGKLLNLILPLGNTFTVPDNKNARIALIGGGVGVAPMLMYGEWLHRNGFKCNFMIGARSKIDLLQLNEFNKYGEVFTTTEDGTYGEKGFITQHSRFNTPNFDYIYTCGPTPMMKAVARYAQENDIFCEASLENVMGCGIGTCLCCVTDTTEGNLTVCAEGPIFNVTKLKWQI